MRAMDLLNGCRATPRLIRNSDDLCSVRVFVGYPENELRHSVSFEAKSLTHSVTLDRYVDKRRAAFVRRVYKPVLCNHAS
jgi:hypothetical protein